MIGIILAAVTLGAICALVLLVRSLERERLEAERLRREIDLAEEQTKIILEPRTEQDAIDRLGSGTF